MAIADPRTASGKISASMTRNTGPQVGEGVGEHHKRCPRDDEQRAGVDREYQRRDTDGEQAGRHTTRPASKLGLRPRRSKQLSARRRSPERHILLWRSATDWVHQSKHQLRSHLARLLPFLRRDVTIHATTARSR
jgi:hypothetical protein